MNEKLKAAFLDMPYKTKNDERPISMQVFLPLKNTPTAVNELIDNLRVEDINEVWDRRVMQLVDVEFPKMSMDVSYDSLADVSKIFYFHSINNKKIFIGPKQNGCQEFIRDNF